MIEEYAMTVGSFVLNIFKIEVGFWVHNCRYCYDYANVLASTGNAISCITRGKGGERRKVSTCDVLSTYVPLWKDFMHVFNIT